MFRKNTAGQTTAFLPRTAQGTTVTSGTWALVFSKDGGAFATGTGTGTYNATGGCWLYTWPVADTNADHIAAVASVTGALSELLNLYPTVHNATTGLPNVDVAKYLGGTAPALVGDTYPAAVGDFSNVFSTLRPMEVTSGSWGETIDSTYTLAGNTTTILNRLGAWTGSGINTILGAFIALFSKVATKPTDLTGTYDPATDSLEANRDNVGTAGAGLTALPQATTILDLCQDDCQVDKTTTPWTLVWKHKTTGVELKRKAAFDVDDNPITSTTVVLGQLVEVVT